MAALESSIDCQFSKLFESARMRALELPNRLIMAAMESNLAAEDHQVSSRMLEYYRRRAAGGVAMVIVEYACVDSSIGFGGTPQLCLDDDKFVESHARLVKAIHDEGAKACLQLYHAGRQSDWYFLANNPERDTFPVFKQHYLQLCQQVLSGDSLSSPDPVALDAPKQQPLSSQENADRLKLLREQFDL